MKLSIIICVYNTKRELFEECLNSIKESTLFCLNANKKTEIIIIDDGSDTNYTPLAEKYGAKYVKTDNRGIFRARSLGVSLASGDCITFVDSDDTVSFNYHLPMVEKIESGADIVMNDWAYHSDSSRYYTYADSTITTTINASGEQIIKKFLSQEGREHSYYVLWNKVYRSEVLKEAIRRAEYDARNTPNYCYSEDVLINFYTFLRAKRLVNLHTGYYFYRIHASQSVSVTSEDRLRTQINLMSFTLNKIEDNLREKAELRHLAVHVDKWRKMMSRTHFTHARCGGYKSLYPYIKEKYRVKILQSSTYRDEICGMRCHPLPDNFTEIEESLFQAYKSHTVPKLLLPSSDYAKRTCKYFKDLGFNKCDTLTVPPQIIPLKKRLRFNPHIMRAARRFIVMQKW